MLTILGRYIAKTMMLATGMVALIVTAILFLMTLLGEFKNMGEGDYGLGQALIYIFMRLPNEFYQFSPMLILLGSIIGLSLLSTHRELAVMRASGFSVRRIIVNLMVAAAILILLITIVGECFAPNLSKRATIRKESAQNSGQAVVTASGVWFHIDNNFIHVRNVVDRSLLEGVTLYQVDKDRHLEAAYFAKTLAFQQDKWTLHDVVATHFYRDRAKSEALATMPWNIKFNSNMLNIGLVMPDEMSLPTLVKFVRYLEKNGLQANEYKYEFWQRILQPLASLVMIFLAVPFVLGAMSTTTLGWRIVMGIVVGFVFYMLNALLGQLAVVYQLPTFAAAFIPILFFAGVGIFLSRQFIQR